jgi:hypothetical protein
MAEILQYKCVKADNKPFLFSDHPVPTEWVSAQSATQAYLNAIREICDTVEISDTEVIFTKTCDDVNSLSRFILTIAMLEIDHKFAVDQFELYHAGGTTFSYTRQEV